MTDCWEAYVRAEKMYAEQAEDREKLEMMAKSYTERLESEMERRNLLLKGRWTEIPGLEVLTMTVTPSSTVGGDTAEQGDSHWDGPGHCYGASDDEKWSDVEIVGEKRGDADRDVIVTEIRKSPERAREMLKVSSEMGVPSAGADVAGMVKAVKRFGEREKRERGAKELCALMQGYKLGQGPVIELPAAQERPKRFRQQ